MRFLLAAAVCLAFVSARASDVEPMLELKAAGGQYYFRGHSASVSGNASAAAAVSARLSERWSVLPAVSSTYEGTKGARELVGGGTLFQERQVHRLSVRGVRELGASWRVKPYAGLRYELLNETRDEGWGGGLFDHRQLELGFEAEREWREPHALRLSLGWFSTKFPNYDALAARPEAARFGLGRPNAGDRPLDSVSYHAAASFDAPLGDRWTGEFSLAERYSRFPGQRLVSASGALLAKEREDALTTLSGAARGAFSLAADARVVLELTGALTHRGSTQNGYDAARGEFFPLAENFFEWRGGAAARAAFGPARRPKQSSLTLELTRRRWPHRPAQNALGTPDGGALTQGTVRVAAGGSWPLTDRVALTFSADWLRAGSNQSYEALYAYRYTASNYLIGFSFEY